MIQRVLSVLLALALLAPSLALADTVAGVELSALTDEQLTELANAIVHEQQNRAQSQSGYLLAQQFEDFFVGLKSYEIIKDSQDEPVLALTFDFSHTDDEEAKIFATTVGYTAYQDGVELGTAFVMGQGDSNQMTKIKAGATLEVRVYCSLTSQSPVELEISALFDFMGKQPVAKTTLTLQ